MKVADFNAKAETLMTKAMWRLPFQRRRCLVPADGFYEWKQIDPKTKQPYAFLQEWRAVRVRRCLGVMALS